MGLGGYAGSLLQVDLTGGRIERKPLDPGAARNFLGGLGLGVKLAYDLMEPGTDPLSPENVVVLCAGPLVGTAAPGASRVCGVTKLPINRAVGWAGAGGMNFGCMLKNAGYDGLILRGRADRPVYLRICDEEVELRSAEGLWGKGVGETCERLWAELGKRSGVVAIGQAGENLVRFAMAFVDRTSTLGRGGLGAVMGSKNLKAVAVEGTKGVGVSDPGRFMELVEGLFERMRGWERLKEWHEFGFWLGLPLLPREVFYELKGERVSCVSCPIGDKDLVRIREGRFGGFTKWTTSALNTVVPMFFGLSLEESVRLVAILDDYGMDMFEFFSVLGFARELRDRGMIRDLDLALEFESLQEWARRIAYREGFGRVLAEGLPGILREFGGAEKFSPPMSKGLSLYSGPEGPLVWERFGTMEFEQLVNPRGAHLASGGSPTYFAVRPLADFPSHLRRMGVPEEAAERILPGPSAWEWGLRLGLVSPGDERGLNVGRLTRYSEDWFSVQASLGVCARAQITRFYSADLLAELYSAATGIPMDRGRLMEAGERIWNLLRAANVREGFDRKDDGFPERWEGKFVEYTGKVRITREMAERFLDDYYQERGWDAERGIPSEEKLVRLGLGEVAEELRRRGAYG